MNILKKTIAIFMTVIFCIGALYYTVVYNKNEKAQGYPVMVNGISIQTRPEKICSLSPGMTENIINITNENPPLVGISDYCGEIIGDLDTKFEKIGSVQNPDIEKIKNLVPDLIICYGKMTESIKQQLGDICNIVEVMPAKTVDEFLNIQKDLIYLLLGAVDGEKKYNEYLSNFDEVVNLNSQIKGKNILMVCDINGKVATGDTFVGNLLNKSGAKNIAEQGKDFNFDIHQLSNEQDIKIDFLIADKSIDEVMIKQSEIFKNISYNQFVRVDFSLIERQSYNCFEIINKIK